MSFTLARRSLMNRTLWKPSTPFTIALRRQMHKCLSEELQTRIRRLVDDVLQKRGPAAQAQAQERERKRKWLQE